MKELFAQSLSNELADSDRVASAVPGQVGAKNILFSKFWAQLKALFGVNNWSAREYKSSPCIVVYNKLQYILDETVAPLPFESTDFPTELAANKWLPLGGGGGGGHTIKDAATTFTQRAGLKFIGNVAVTDDSGGDNTVVEIVDSESIFFDDITVKAKISRPYNFTVSAKTESGGTGTITTSLNAAYTLGATVTANDYVKVAASAVNTRIFLTLTRV